MTRQSIARFISGGYLAVSVAILVFFIIAPADGLANIWIFVWTLPLALPLNAVLKPIGMPFPFIPSGEVFGYYGTHIAYFVPATLSLAAVIFLILRGRKS